MKILIKDGYVDFEAPIQMTDYQREKFIKFMKKMFPSDFKTREVSEKSKEMGEREASPKKWTINEYSLLLSPKSNKELAKKLGRTEMSVKMERGHFVPEFMVWAKKKGYALSEDKKIIQEFLDKKGRR